MLSFAAIRRLPLTLPVVKTPTDEECVDVQIGGAHVVVTHIYQIVLGAVFHVSISGSEGEEALIVEAMTAEFGEPLSRDVMPTSTHYEWESDCPLIPETDVHKHVTKEEMKAIGAKHSLDEQDELTLQDLLASFTTLFGKDEARIAYVAHQLSLFSEERRMNILAALLEVNTLYAERRLGFEEPPART